MSYKTWTFSDGCPPAGEREEWKKEFLRRNGNGWWYYVTVQNDLRPEKFRDEFPGKSLKK